MASPGSFIRSAARATSCAHRRLPIRWRLAGGSALLTFVILCLFAVMVAILAARQVRSDFDREVHSAATRLARGMTVTYDPARGLRCAGLPDYRRVENAHVRVLLGEGHRVCGDRRPDLGYPRPGSADVGGYRVVSRSVPVLVGGIPSGTVIVQYGRPLSEVRRTLGGVRLLLLFGVLGGSGLALLAGLAVARRAMAPVTALTAAAGEITRTRDPRRRLPVPEAQDEVAELAHTLGEMLAALDAARSETETTLERQRGFLADASHELRTPLTSVLSHLELLAAELDGEPRDSAESALRSTRRMRRLVADMLLLARADAGRRDARRPTDLAAVAADAAGELEPVSGGHEIVVSTRPAVVLGSADELHRLALNLIENAVRHTPPGTTVQVTVTATAGVVELRVSDDGPGVAPELADRVFDRFVRGAGDAGEGAGLGLAIVRAVAEAHGGEVRLERRGGLRGACFVVALPAAAVGAPGPAGVSA